jgi:hypothetical protein
MTLRLLVDECLLAGVRADGRGGRPRRAHLRKTQRLVGDWKLIEPVVEGDYTLVTHNVLPSWPGPKGN